MTLVSCIATTHSSFLLSSCHTPMELNKACTAGDEVNLIEVSVWKYSASI
ncbi:hypothetical protein AG0111_0g5865 [Alternaria gaisen]|uniref:Uncharacterized protein n=1 Tax=Alternaria gaisen TaxID=167740 RepID=A0ACB6FP05_9PLEO|nr:hypothetical protein AG0111_0g5865 [Alternaria gaisen]